MCGLKMANFSDVQYCIYADIEGGWVRKVQIVADVIYGWSLNRLLDK